MVDALTFETIDHFLSVFVCTRAANVQYPVVQINAIWLRI